MPQQESEDEARARRFAGTALGLTFEFTDLTGDVDFTSADGSLALEVTRYTNPKLKMDMKVAATADYVLPLGTGYDWWVTFAGYPRFKGLVQRLYGALQSLESHELECYSDTMRWWLDEVSTLDGALQTLSKEGVLEARRALRQLDVAQLVIMTSGGWNYGGPDRALDLLEARVALDRTHTEKLARQTSPLRGLWVWVDEHTEPGLTRALSPEESRLPGRAPDLPAGIERLWVVDEGSGRGWHWGRSKLECG